MNCVIKLSALKNNIGLSLFLSQRWSWVQAKPNILTHNEGTRKNISLNDKIVDSRLEKKKRKLTRLNGRIDS